MGILSGMDIEKINEKVIAPLESNLDLKFKEQLNSTIGTENEKPLDFLSKNILASDDHYYRKKMSYGRRVISQAVKPSVQTNGAQVMAFNESKELVYLAGRINSETEGRPVALKLSDLGTSSGYTHYNDYYTYNGSTYPCVSIAYDEVTNCVFYAGKFSQQGSYFITKFNYSLNQIIGTTPFQNSLGILLAGGGFVYDINATTNPVAIKKYNAPDMSLVGTYTFPLLRQVSGAKLVNGNLYVFGYDQSSYTLFAKINAVTFDIDYRIGRMPSDTTFYNVLNSFAVDQDYSYVSATFVEPNAVTKKGIVEIRNSDGEITRYAELPADLDGLSVGVYYSESTADCHKDLVVFITAKAAVKYLLFMDKASMKFSYLTAPALRAVASSGEYLYALETASGLITKSVETYVDSGEYERVE